MPADARRCPPTPSAVALLLQNPDGSRFLYIYTCVVDISYSNISLVYGVMYDLDPHTVRVKIQIVS